MKKGLLTLLVFAVTVTLSFGFLADTADAKKRGGGGFQSNKQSVTPKNEASKTDNTSQSSQTNRNNNTTNAAQPNKTGGFLKGLAFGGLAGLLFGSMFANMGGFGEILSLLVNIVLVVGIVMIIRAAWIYIRNNKKTANNGPNYNRYNDYNNRRHDDDNENNR